MTHPNVVLDGTLAILKMDQQEAPEVVRKFLDVFPEDLPGLPPNRKVGLQLMNFLVLSQSPRHRIRWHQ